MLTTVTLSMSLSDLIDINPEDGLGKTSTDELRYCSSTVTIFPTPYPKLAFG